MCFKLVVKKLEVVFNMEKKVIVSFPMSNILTTLTSSKWPVVKGQSVAFTTVTVPSFYKL